MFAAALCARPGKTSGSIDRRSDSSLLSLDVSIRDIARDSLSRNSGSGGGGGGAVFKTRENSP